MNEGTEKMKLGEFIARMKQGWGFWRGSRVQRIGAALDAAVPADMRDKPVTVEFVKGTRPKYRLFTRFWSVP